MLSVDQNLLQKIIVEEIDTEALKMSHHTIETRKFQIADDVFYWLDNHDVPVQRQYTHDGADYLVKVTNYAHR